MSESSAMNSDDKLKDVVPQKECIKTEVEVPVVKPEPHECVVCASLSLDTYDIYSSRTAASGSLLHNFITKFTNVEFTYTSNISKYICKNCFDLVNVLEQAEIEYVKLKETFEAIISKNPLFESHCVQPIRLDTVKNESINQYNNASNLHNDSEDEPLAVTKKKRNHKVQKRKKKGTSSIGKRKVRNKPNVDAKTAIDDSWECNECGDIGIGGPIAEAAHQLSEHNPILRDIKKEDSNDGQYSNGFDENILKIELMHHDDDDSSNYIPDDEPSLDEPPPKRKVTLVARRRGARPAQKKEKKALHRCDKCDAKYTSLARLQQHQAKHDGSKPPYICEVCGAHYKHKRACDIHVAMHKGISDWKCEECNKLFPSKGALQRHNNIHTGKLNYQCDLCGKSFIHTSSFKMHKLSHSGLKPHSCDVCGLALMTRSHLKRHKRVHSGEKRHECTVCGKRFSERYNLMAHSKAHEPGAAGEAAAGGAGAGAAPARRRLFRCPFCAERFERRYMLERHAAAAHGRALERPPPTPRNTMSKLLKAQAARHPPAAHTPDTPDTDSKDARSPDSRSTPIPTSKLMAHLSAGAGGGSWSGAYAEFNLRTDYH